MVALAVATKFRLYRRVLVAAVPVLRDNLAFDWQIIEWRQITFHFELGLVPVCLQTICKLTKFSIVISPDES